MVLLKAKNYEQNLSLGFLLNRYEVVVQRSDSVGFRGMRECKAQKFPRDRLEPPTHAYPERCSTTEHSSLPDRKVPEC